MHYIRAMFAAEVGHILRKEFKLEFAQKFPFTGMLLYIFSTVFICYLSLYQIIDVKTWNALFWILSLFAAVNAVAKSFLQESAGLNLYYYTFIDPQALIIARILYNMLLLTVLMLLTYFIYALLIGNLVQNHGMFILCIVLGSCGLSSVLTIVSAISARGSNSSAMMAILGFPLLFPLLITILKFSKNIIDGIPWSVSYKYAMVLMAINIITITLGYILFPYLWRE